MTPDEVPAELVEKAANALSILRHGIPDEYSDHTRTEVRHALAAVLPEYGATVLEKAAHRMRPHGECVALGSCHEADVQRLNRRAARLRGES